MSKKIYTLIKKIIEITLAYLRVISIVTSLVAHFSEFKDINSNELYVQNVSGTIIYSECEQQNKCDTKIVVLFIDK